MRLAAGIVMAPLLLLAPCAAADSGKNFVVTIDGVDYGIDPGESLTVKGRGGQDLKLGLRQSDVETFHGDYVSFQHGKDISVTSTTIQSGLKQHMMATNLGTLMLVQEYADIDPRSLAELMLKQLAKDDLRDGGALDKQAAKRKAANGTGLEGLTGKITIKKGTATRTVRCEVLTGGTDDHGIIAVTRIDSDASPDDQKAIDRFWETLAVKY